VCQICAKTLWRAIALRSRYLHTPDSSPFNEGRAVTTPSRSTVPKCRAPRAHTPLTHFSRRRRLWSHIAAPNGPQKAIPEHMASVAVCSMLSNQHLRICNLFVNRAFRKMS